MNGLGYASYKSLFRYAFNLFSKYYNISAIILSKVMINDLLHLRCD